MWFFYTRMSPICTYTLHSHCSASYEPSTAGLQFAECVEVRVRTRTVEMKLPKDWMATCGEKKAHNFFPQLQSCQKAFCLPLFRTSSTSPLSGGYFAVCRLLFCLDKALLSSRWQGWCRSDLVNLGAPLAAHLPIYQGKQLHPAL